jgi:Nucleoside-diphosphate-sugar epimerases
MRIVVTGAGGFLGKAVLPLLGNYEVVSTDRRLPTEIDGVEGDLCDPAFIRDLIGPGCDAVIHLASMPGAAVAADPARGWAVNLDGLRLLADAAARAGNRPRFVYASSIAVLGDLRPDQPVDDETALLPCSHYGALKVMGETWLAMLHRQNVLSAVSLRLPGLVARPPGGSGFGSAFLSEMFWAIADGRRLELPVSREGVSWLMSASSAATNIVHALTVQDRDLPPSRAVTLPVVRVTMADLIAAVAQHCGREPYLTHVPVAAIQRSFASYPPLRAAAAEAAGFRADSSLNALVAAAMEQGGAWQARG